MNFFNNIFQRREAMAPGSAESKPSPVQGGSFGSQAVCINDPSSSLVIPAWYRASEVLATTMSMLVMEYQKLNDKAHGGNYAVENRVDGKHLNYLFQMQPNLTMTAAQFWAQMTLHRLFDGNAVAYIDRNDMDDVRAIWLCHEASLNTVNFTYTIAYNTPRGPVSKTGVESSNIIHWRNTFSNDHGLTGIGTLKYARQTLSLAATNDRQAKSISAKGGKHKILLQEKPHADFALSILNKEQKEAQRDNLQKGLDEAHDVLLVSGDMDTKIISQDAQAQQLLESRKFDIPAIGRYTGVPLVLLMDYSNNTYKAPEQAMQAFLQHTISPMANSLEMEINVKMLGEIGFPTHRFHFCNDALMRLDPMGRATLGKILLETGVKCVNELRAESDLPAIEEGDRHFISTNLQPVDNPSVGAKELEPGNYTVKNNKGTQGGEEGDKQ